MYKVAQMEFRQILTESFNCQMLRKALKSFFFHWLQKTQSLTMMLKKSVTVSLEEDANQLSE
jgi:hypothetical protein